MAFFSFFRPLARLIPGNYAAEPKEAQLLYEKLVIQSRQPLFYEKLHVPDTVEGRYDVITLHMFAILRRLKAGPEKAGDLGQALFNTMLQDMDDNLREMGVGDLRVGKKMRELGEIFYGRVTAYEKAMPEMAEGELHPLEEALARNFRPLTSEEDGEGGEAPGVAASALAAYLQKTITLLEAQDIADIAKGRISFPDISS
ncbi:MAG: ubiquinol-cytochrome C chaperone family protein [Pseudomonadota bacterium]